MKIAIGSDEYFNWQKELKEYLIQLGHEIALFGAVTDLKEHDWIQVASNVSQAVQSKRCDEGILICWTGTGVCIASNKFKGIRAALCTDAQTAKGARLWNQANILCLSNRLMNSHLAKEIMDAWLATYPAKSYSDCTKQIIALENLG